MSKSNTHKVLERLAKNFVLIPPLSISRKEMIVTLPAEVREQIIRRLAEKGIPHQGVDFRVRLFGGRHKTFKDEVLAPHAALRTYSDREGTPTRRKVPGCKAASDRILPIGRLTDWLKNMAALESYAKTSLHTFLPHYDECLQVGRDAVDHNFPFVVEFKGDKMKVSEVLKKMTPSKDAFASAFAVEIPQPRRLTVTDWSDVDIPAELADKWAEDELASIQDQIENAKE
jgi:hypothetical protein